MGNWTNGQFGNKNACFYQEHYNDTSPTSSIIFPEEQFPVSKLDLAFGN